MDEQDVSALDIRDNIPKFLANLRAQQGTTPQQVNAFEATRGIRQGIAAAQDRGKWFDEHLQERAALLRNPSHDAQPFVAERDWPTVAREFQSFYPGEDPEPFRQAYIQAATQTNDAASFARQVEQFRRIEPRTFMQSITTDTNIGQALGAARPHPEAVREGDLQRSRLLPFAGQGVEAIDNVNVLLAANRMRDGTATTQDRTQVARFLGRDQRNQNRDTLTQVQAVLENLPAFGIELIATGGALSGARAGGTRVATGLISRAIGEQAAASLAGRAVVATTSIGAGVVAQGFAARPGAMVAGAAQRSIPGINAQGNQLRFQDQGDMLANAPAAIGNELIEVGSEQAGEALKFVPALARRLPGFGTFADRWAASLPGRTVNSIDRGLGRIASMTGYTSYHGIAGEMMEERLGEFLRGLTGIARRPDGSPDYGVIGDMIAGRSDQAHQQLLVEAMAFAPLAALGIGVSVHQRAGLSPQGRAFQDAHTWMQSRGFTEQERSAGIANIDSLIREAGPQGREAAVARINEEMDNGPLRDYAVSLAEKLPTEQEMRDKANEGQTIEGLRQTAQEGIAGLRRSMADPLVELRDQLQRMTTNAQTDVFPGAAQIAASTGRAPGVQPEQTLPSLTQPGSPPSDRTFTPIQNPTEAAPDARTVEKTAAPDRFIEIRKEIEKDGGNSTKAATRIVGDVQRYIDAGGTVSLWFDGKEVPIVKTNPASNHLVDAKGQPWGTLSLAMGQKGTKTGIELKSPAASAIPLPSAEQRLQETIKTPLTEAESYSLVVDGEQKPKDAADVKRESGSRKKSAGRGRSHAHSGRVSTATTLPQPQASGEPISNFAVIRSFEKIFGTRFFPDRLRRLVNMLYHVAPEIITHNGRAAGDLAVASHEIGHHLDKQTDALSGLSRQMLKKLGLLDYDPKKKRPFEGFAEVVRQYVFGDIQGDYATIDPDVRTWFENWMANNPDWGSRIVQARGLVTQWGRQSEIQQAMGKVNATGVAERPADETTAEKYKDIGGRAWNGFQEIVTDDANAALRFERAAEAKGHVFKDGSRPSEVYYAQMYAADQWAYEFVQEGIFSFRQDPATGERHRYKISPSLNGIAEGVSKEDLKPGDRGVSFMELFWLADHIAEERSRGVDTGGLTPEETKAILDEAARDPKRLAALQESRRRATSYDNSLWKPLVDLGMVDQSTVDKMVAAHPYYVPLMRVVEGSRKGPGVGNDPNSLRAAGLVKRTGSEYQIISPLTVMIQRSRVVAKLMQMQMNRLAAIETIKTPGDKPGQNLKLHGMGSWIFEVDQPQSYNVASNDQVLASIEKAFEQAGINPVTIKNMLGILDPVVFSYFTPEKTYKGAMPIQVVMEKSPDVTDKKGNVTIGKVKPHFYRISEPALYDFMAGQSQHSLDLPKWLQTIVLPLRLTVKAIKFGAVQLSHTFTFMNFLRDMPSFMLASEEAGFLRADKPLKEYHKSFWFYARQLWNADVNKADYIFREYQRMGGEQHRAFGFDVKGIASQKSDLMGNMGLRGVANVVKNKGELLMKVLGSPEAAPRVAEMRAYLANRGYTAERIEKELKANPGRDPVPYHIIVGAMNAGQVVTVPFGRLGTGVRKINLISAFFGPSIAGLNWQANLISKHPGRVAMALGALMAMELAMHALGGDEDDDTSTNMRFSFWTFKIGETTYRIPKPHGIFKVISSLFGELLRAKSATNPNFRQWALNTASEMIPNPTPSALRVASQMQSNQSWMNTPIVPNHALEGLQPRDQAGPNTSPIFRGLANLAHGTPLEHSPAMAEYFVDQVTGGLSGYVTGKRLKLHPFAVPAQTQSVQDFYDEYERLRRLTGSSTIHGETVSRADQDRYHVMNNLSHIMADVRRQGQALPDEQRQQHQRYVNAIARAALGRPDIEGYTNPLRASNWASLPAGVREAVQADMAVLLDRLGDRQPQRVRGQSAELFNQRVADWRESQRQAQMIVDMAGMSAEQRRGILQSRFLEQSVLRRVTPEEAALTGMPGRLNRGQQRELNRVGR